MLAKLDYSTTRLCVWRERIFRITSMTTHTQHTLQVNGYFFVIRKVNEFSKMEKININKMVNNSHNVDRTHNFYVKSKSYDTVLKSYNDYLNILVLYA